MLTVVTGASGHIGGNLVRALLAKGRKVRAIISRDTRALEGLPVEFVRGDIHSVESLKKAFHGAESVYHLAGIISISGDKEGAVRRANVDGVNNVVEACLASGVSRLVHFSSIHAYTSNPKGHIIEETSPLALAAHEHPYDRTKAEGQLAVQQACRSGLNAVIINPTGVLGPYDFKPSRMGEFFINIYHGKFPLLVNGGYNWVDARDVAQGAILAEEKGRCGESYILGGRWAHICEISALISKATGMVTVQTAAPMWLASAAASVSCRIAELAGRSGMIFTPEAMKALDSHRNVSSKKAETELGYRARPLEETVYDTFKWFEEAGMLRGK